MGLAGPWIIGKKLSNQSVQLTVFAARAAVGFKDLDKTLDR